MAAIGAVQNGLWSSSTTWPGGVFPTAADDVFANTRTVYIDQNINVLSLNTTASGAGGSTGGLFYNTGSISITAGIIRPGTTNVLTLTGINNINILSNLIVGSATTTNTWGVIIPGSLTPPNVSVNAYISGGSFAGTTGGIRQEAGTLSISGTMIGGPGNGTCPGVYIINVGNYPVVFTGRGTVIGGDVNSSAAGINTVYVGTENAAKNSSITFYGTVSGSNQRPTGNGITTYAIRAGGTIPVYIYGDVIGGTGGPVAGVQVGQSAVGVDGTNYVMISGNIYSGVANLSAGQYNAVRTFGSNNRLDIIGNLINVESLNPIGCLELGSITGTTSITGNIISSSGIRNTSNVIIQQNTTSCTIYGNVSGGRGRGIDFSGTPSLSVFGDVFGGFSSGTGSGAMGIAVGSNSRGNVNVYGTVTAGTSSFCHGISYGSSVITSVYAKRLKGNAYGIGTVPTSIAQVYAVGPAQNVQPIHPFNVVCEELEFGPFGAPPILTNVTFLDKTTNTITMPITSTSTQTKTLVDPNFNNIMPPVSSVRQGVVYSGGNLVGTCSVPTVEEVEFGVPVDNTVGIAALRPSNIWNTSSTELTSLSTTIGYKLNNAATSETVGQLVAAFGA